METYNITLQEIQSTGTTQSQTKKDVQSGSGEYDVVFTNTPPAVTSRRTATF